MLRIKPSQSQFSQGVLNLSCTKNRNLKQGGKTMVGHLCSRCGKYVMKIGRWCSQISYFSMLIFAANKHLYYILAFPGALVI